MRNKYERALIYIGETIVRKLHEHAPKNAIIHDCFPEQFKLLKELVDKATPKKPIYAKGYPSSSCPNCFSNLGDNKYCRDCGQAIDWSNDE